VNISLPSRVVFDFGSAVLRRETDPLITRAAALARRTSGRIRVIGFTDNVGSAAFNRVLSSQRAQAVRRALRRNGVPLARITAEGAGITRRFGSNATVLGRQRNRRVVIVLNLPAARVRL
jgi:outer membrane protein OmpA-like peptidoglycan-associated protein